MGLRRAPRFCGRRGRSLPVAAAGKAGGGVSGAVSSRADTDCFSVRKVTRLKPLPRLQLLFSHVCRIKLLGAGGIYLSKLGLIYAWREGWHANAFRSKRPRSSSPDSRVPPSAVTRSFDAAQPEPTAAFPSKARNALAD